MQSPLNANKLSRSHTSTRVLYDYNVRVQYNVPASGGQPSPVPFVLTVLWSCLIWYAWRLYLRLHYLAYITFVLLI